MDLLKDQMRLQPSRIEEVVQVSCSGGGGVREERLEDWFLVIGAGLPRTGTSSLKKAISMLTGVQVWLSLSLPETMDENISDDFTSTMKNLSDPKSHFFLKTLFVCFINLLHRDRPGIALAITFFRTLFTVHRKI